MHSRLIFLHGLDGVAEFLQSEEGTQLGRPSAYWIAVQGWRLTGEKICPFIKTKG